MFDRGDHRSSREGAIVIALFYLLLIIHITYLYIIHYPLIILYIEMRVESIETLQSFLLLIIPHLYYALSIFTLIPNWDVKCEDQHVNVHTFISYFLINTKYNQSLIGLYNHQYDYNYTVIISQVLSALTLILKWDVNRWGMWHVDVKCNL